MLALPCQGRVPCRPTFVVLLLLLPWYLGDPSVTTAEQTTDDGRNAADRQELLRLHEAVLAAHRNHDVDSWLRDESDHYVVVNRGEIDYPDLEARRALLGPYLQNTIFQEYVDIVEPVVRLSADATLGWVIAQVHIVGTRKMPDGTSVDFDDTWAWIELYEKQEGRWRRIGNVSNHKPE